MRALELSDFLEKTGSVQKLKVKGFQPISKVLLLNLNMYG